MAKLDMQRVKIFAPISQQKGIMTLLQGMSVLDLSAATEAPHSGFTREDRAEEAAEYRKLSAGADKALAVLASVVPEGKGLLASFSGRRKVTLDEFNAIESEVDNLEAVCDRLHSLDREKAEAAAEIIRTNTLIEQLSPWEGIDLPLSFTGTEKTATFIGTIQGSYTLETLLEALAKAAPEVEPYVEIVGYAAGQTLVCVISSLSEKEKTQNALRGLGFALPPSTENVLPAQRIDELRQKNRELGEKIEAANSEIADLAQHRRSLELLCDWYLSAGEMADTAAAIDRSGYTVCITGYLPTCDLPLMKEKLEEEFTVHIEAEPAADDDAPVKLKNNAFTEPAQSITSMYALPSSADIDPTPITSFFYYLFFGIMLSDAGYGILMWIATWAVNRFLDPEPNMRKNMKLFMYCGISTTLWGLFFGSFFGVDIITAIFGQLPFKYPFINPLNGDALAMLILSVGLGFVQIIAGLAVKFYISAKADGIIDALLDTGLWITTLSGFAVMAVGMITLPVLQTVGLVVAFGSMALIAITGGRKKKGAMKIFGGIANLYDITGYVSDLLSFSRLMALGLTTAAMSMVFNKLGVMVSAGIAGKVFMVAILLVGHAINFGLNALGAYVHTLRLQYVELFSKFYEGGGRPFKPFAFKGKYIRIKEEK
ncbi:MAG: V-type ATP synthase subunit I [Clostridia bacterium]|nr:V-type ATP synthase subunit I [Clostridia bacterium]